MNRLHIALLIPALFLDLAAGPAGALEWDYALMAGNRYTLQENLLSEYIKDFDIPLSPFMDPIELIENVSKFGRDFDLSRHFYSAYLIGTGSLSFDFPFSFTLTLDNGELSEETFVDDSLDNEMLDDYFVREAYAWAGLLRDEWVEVELGRRHVVAGSGYILDSYEPAAWGLMDLEGRFDLPLRIKAWTALVNNENPYTHIQIDYPISRFERLSLFASWYHDRADSLADLILERMSFTFRDRVIIAQREIAYEISDMKSRGHLFYVGLQGNKNFRRLSLSGAAIVEFGEIELRARAHRLVSRDGELKRSSEYIYDQVIPCLAYLVDAEAELAVTENLSLTAFFLMASGEGNPVSTVFKGSRIDTFLSIVPFITQTNIFFSGGINENYSTRAFRSSGTDGRGFIVPGLRCTWFITDDLWLESTAAYLLAHKEWDVDFKGRDYGIEGDLVGYYVFGDHVTFSFEADIFFPGDFFDKVSKTHFDPAFQLLAGIDLYF